MLRLFIPVGLAAELETAGSRLPTGEYTHRPIQLNGTQHVRFLPCDALRCTVFVIVILSVRLSVRLSVTLVDCVHKVRPTIMISSRYGSPIILVSGDITLIPKFEGGHRERGR